MKGSLEAGEYSRAYEQCLICPRRCGVDRTRGERGFCGCGNRPAVAAALRHFGEEPVLTGEGGLKAVADEQALSGGSGTIFFIGCTMRCGFCQNRQISRGGPPTDSTADPPAGPEGAGTGAGTNGEIDLETLISIMLDLQEAGAVNINFVSAAPFVPHVATAVREARRRGLHIPTVWNSSGYESEETVELLSSVIDIFLPDLKLLNEALASRLFAVPGYPAAAAKTIQRMAEAAGPPRISESGLLLSGTMVRHLVLPGLFEETEKVLEWFSDNCVSGSRKALFSLMLQFRVPIGPQEPKGWRRGVNRLENRKISGAEYAALIAMLDEYGIEDGFIQEPGDEEAWWPDFTRANPFPDGCAVPLWSMWDRAGR